MAGRTSHPAPHRTPSMDVEAAIVDAAERLLLAGGEQALTVRAIAAEAGVAPMSVYNRFDGKGGVVDALFMRGFDALRDTFAELDVDDPLEALLVAGRRYRALALAQPARYAVMFERAVREFQPSDEAHEHAYASFLELVRLVQRALDAGALRPEDPVELAQQIWSGCHGAVSLELREIGFAADPAVLHEEMVRTTLRGLAVDPARVDALPRPTKPRRRP